MYVININNDDQNDIKLKNVAQFNKNNTTKMYIHIIFVISTC